MNRHRESLLLCQKLATVAYTGMLWKYRMYKMGSELILFEKEYTYMEKLNKLTGAWLGGEEVLDS